MTSKAKATDVLRQVANAVIIPLAIAYNFWPRPSGETIGEISRQHEPVLAASGWAFSIWGLIFLGHLAYAIYQALPAQRANPTLRRIGFFTALACLGGGLWNAFFTAQLFAAAWVTMLFILGSLIAVEVKLRNAARHGSELWLIRAPFALNLGWISVATILNSAQFFSSLGWQGAPLTPTVWAMIVISIAIVLGVSMAIFRRNLGYATVVAWGLAAIATYKRGDEPSIALVAAGGAIILAALVIAEGIAIWRGSVGVNVSGARGV